MHWHGIFDVTKKILTIFPATPAASIKFSRSCKLNFNTQGNPTNGRMWIIVTRAIKVYVTLLDSTVLGMRLNFYELNIRINC